MVLGLGYGDLLVVAIVAAVLVGPNDVPKVARLAGRATGRAVSLVSRFRDRAVDLAGASEAGKLAADLSRATRALEAVGADLRGGVSLRSSGVGGGRAAGASSPVAPGSVTASPSFAASPLAAAAASRPSPPPPAVQVLEISAEAVRSARQQRAASSVSPSPSSSFSSSPPRSVVTGSDVAAAAIEEEAVSLMAAKFLGAGRQQEQQQQQGRRQ